MIQERDVTSLVPVTRFQAHATYITRILLSPDVRHLATCSADHTAKIWAVDREAAQGSPATSTQVTTSTSTSASVSTANKTLPIPTPTSKPAPLNKPSLPGGPPSAGVNGEPHPNAFPLETTLHGHQRWVWECAFSADSAYLVTACSDHFARLWELSSQSIIRQYSGHHRGVVAVALNDYSER